MDRGDCRGLKEEAWDTKVPDTRRIILEQWRLVLQLESINVDNS